jgi:hypothetical protein
MGSARRMNRATYAVKTPDAAKVRSGVEQSNFEAQLPENVEMVDAGEATADDDRVEVFSHLDATRCG